MFQKPPSIRSTPETEGNDDPATRRRRIPQPASLIAYPEVLHVCVDWREFHAEFFFFFCYMRIGAETPKDVQRVVYVAYVMNMNQLSTHFLTAIFLTLCDLPSKCRVPKCFIKGAFHSY